MSAPADPAAPFRNEPAARAAACLEREALAGALAELDRRLPIGVPVWWPRERTRGGRLHLDRPRPPERVVATAAEATPAEAEAAVGAAAEAGREWGRRPAAERAQVLLDAAEELRRRRLELAALEVRECAKPWAEADADVCEAIDYLVYYAREALRLGPGPALEQAPGERNTMRYVAARRRRGDLTLELPARDPGRDDSRRPRGRQRRRPEAGRAVARRPRSPGRGPARGRRPPGALSLLPGHGPVGAALVRDPRVHVIAFTGSSAVGLEIVRAAAETPPGQDHVKRVIAEMGGKNCAIVDADADLDDAVPAIVASAFAYAGQKCSAISRVLAHEAIHDSLGERLAGAVELLRVGQADELETEVPPVIERRRRSGWRRYQELAESDGRILARGRGPGRTGLVLPRRRSLQELDPSSSVLRDEVFGPLLTVEPVASIEAACDVVDGLPFALTGALFSRNPATVEAVVGARPSATSTSTAAPPGRWSGASPSAATASQASARRPAARTTCSSSPTRGSSPRTRPATGWWWSRS